MSQSLVVKWADGSFDDVQLGSLEGVRTYWAPLARELGLQHFSECDGFVRIDPCEVDAVLTELSIFRPAYVRKFPDHTDMPEKFSRIKVLLERMKASTGWRASIG